MPVLCQEYMLFFCLPLSSQPRLNLLSTQQQGRAGGGGGGARGGGAGEVEPWLTTQGQTEKKHILLTGEGKIFFTHIRELSYGVSPPNLWWIHGESLVNGKKHGPSADIFSELNV